MKRILYTFIILFSFQLSAEKSGGNLMLCLAKEEATLHHAKSTGPQYFLNQKIINEASSAGEFKLKKKYFHEICTIKEFPPSIGLLKLLLLKETDIFKKIRSKNQSFTALYKANYESLVDRSPRLLFDLLANIQSQTLYPYCLNENIPELKKFVEKFQYLQVDVNPRELIKDKSIIKNIFSKLNLLTVIYEECDKKQNQLLKKIKTKR